MDRKINNQHRKTLPVIVLLPPAMQAELSHVAKESTLSRSAVVREACREYLQKRRCQEKEAMESATPS